MDGKDSNWDTDNQSVGFKLFLIELEDQRIGPFGLLAEARARTPINRQTILKGFILVAAT